MPYVYPPTDDHITAWARMARATTAILQVVAGDLKRAGLPPLEWYDVLLELRRARPEGLRPKDLQEEILIPQSNMSRLIDRMEAAGYVERGPCDGDGRGQIVRITGAGNDLLRRMWPVYREALGREFASAISQNEAVDLARILALRSGTATSSTP
jgi:DNA-binding MarR family transcriptional regulator